MTPQDIQALFTRQSGTYVFARWGRPIVPVVFGVDDATLSTIKGAIEAVVTLAGHRMAETDPELGANLMLFFCRDWAELADVPNLDQLIPELPTLIPRLQAVGANQYRLFRFDPDGAIRACFAVVRMDGSMTDQPADTIALTQATLMILAWGDSAFAGGSPLGAINDVAVLRPEIAAVIRAAYDPVLPVAAQDPGHALRLFARIPQPDPGTLT